ncbi:histidine kinase-like ATPase [Powellomyces hirtus]|nr:histidine kinase-like ATPase [Powellomyces hirtus]
MSHELRTPLTSIIGHVDLMAETDMDALQREYMHSAKRAASTLLSVINDILDYSKLMAGMVDMDPHVTHLNEVLTDIHAITRDLGKDVHLVVCNYDGPYLVLDAVRLRQILLNLVGNAVKFTEPGGLVHVTATYTLPTPNTATLTLAVRDTGIGIPPSVVPRLFQPFMQADASISRRFGGTGLGLSIVKKLVTAMGGTIRVDSVENMGATFTVTLTVPTAAPPLASQPAVVAAADLKILVAEDNPVTQKLLLRMLKPCDVTIADNGQIAVDLIRHSDPRAAPPYNIMLCDVNMPVMDGLTATRTIRTLPQGRDIYIIGLTANGFKKDRDDCLAAGMDAYLSKPFTKVGLLQLIHSAHRSASIGDDIDGVNPPPPPLPPLHPTTAPNNPSSQPQPQPPPPVTTTPRLPRVLDLSRIGKGVRASELVLCSTDTLVTSLSANGSGTAGMGFAAMHPHQHPPHNGIHHQHHQQQQQQQQ